jgi:hypothetical protein
MVTMETLSVVQGERKVVVDDDTPEGRKKLAKNVSKMLKDGFAVFLNVNGEHSRITGYDEVKNEWILQKEHGQKKAKRVTAKNSKIDAVAPAAGG